MNLASVLFPDPGRPRMIIKTLDLFSTMDRILLTISTLNSSVFGMFLRKSEPPPLGDCLLLDCFDVFDVFDLANFQSPSSLASLFIKKNSRILCLFNSFKLLK